MVYEALAVSDALTGKTTTGKTETVYKPEILADNTPTNKIIKNKANKVRKTEDKPAKKATTSKATKTADELCGQNSGKTCKYGPHLFAAACGELVINFHINWKTGEPANLEAFSSLKTLIKKEGGVIVTITKSLGMMQVCYNLNPKELELKKKQLEEHPAVSHVSYNMTVVPDAVPEG